jgi:hypothetical protein
MERCPDKETLEKLVDYELTEEMNENILSHLSICSSCRAKVGCLLSEEQGLLKSLLTEPASRRHAVTVASGRCLSNAAILAYAGNSLKEDQLKLVESHLEKCDNCAFELLRLQRSMNTPAEIDLDMSNLRATPGVGTNVLEIVLKAKNKLIELIRHNGELLSLTPQLGAVRGKEEKEERPIVIRKDFQERDLSAEVTIKREVPDSGGVLTVSVMKLSSEEFLSGLEVEMSGVGMSRQAMTNADGVVEFYGITAGTYSLALGGDDIAIITIE